MIPSIPNHIFTVATIMPHPSPFMHGRNSASGIQLESVVLRGAGTWRLSVTSVEPISHDELVQFATYLYGSNWRESLAKQLGLSRKSLVLTLAADAPIPQNIVVSVIELVEARLAEIEIERKAISLRITELRKSVNAEGSGPQPRVSRSAAS